MTVQISNAFQDDEKRDSQSRTSARTQVTAKAGTHATEAASMSDDAPVQETTTKPEEVATESASAAATPASNDASSSEVSPVAAVSEETKTDAPTQPAVTATDAAVPATTSVELAETPADAAPSTPSKSEKQPQQSNDRDEVKQPSDAGDSTPRPKPVKRTAAGSVGKAAIVKSKSTAGMSTPAKRTPAAKMPSSAKASSSRKKVDFVPAKQLPKTPTANDTNKATRSKANIVATPHSVTRATRSSTAKQVPSAKATEQQSSATTPVKKKILFRAARNHVSVADRPTISSSLKRAEAKRAAQEKAIAARAQPKTAPFKSTVTASEKKAPTKPVPVTNSAKAAAVTAKPKRTLNYKPYTGPLPEYKEDPLFSPVTRGANKAAGAQTAKPTRAQTPAKAGKENAKPSNARAAPAKPAGRTPIKKAASSTAVAGNAKDARRAKFAQDAKTNAAGARQSPRRIAAAATAKSAA